MATALKTNLRKLLTKTKQRALKAKHRQRAFKTKSESKGRLRPELNPDVNVNDESAWDIVSYTTQQPAWSFDSNSLLYGPQKTRQICALLTFHTTHNVEYTVEIDVTNYDGDNSTNPIMELYIGYNNAPIAFNLFEKPSVFTLSTTAVADNTGIGSEPSVYIGIATDLPPIHAWTVIGNATLKIQRISIKES